MIHLIRHPKPDIDMGTCYGQLNVDVPASFIITEANKIKPRIWGIDYDMIFSSPLRRCVKFANELFPGVEVNYDERLMEMHFGKFEGMLWDSVYQSEGAKEWFADWVNYPCPDGESFKDVVHRIRHFIDEYKIKRDDQICIVTHGGVIGAFQVIFNHVDPENAFKVEVKFGEIVTI